MLLFAAPWIGCQNRGRLFGESLERALDDSHGNDSRPSVHGPQQGRLDSWKKIASYLKRDVSTVQRWERREAMPVHRHLHDKLGSVFAYRAELDAWWESRRTRLTQEGAGEAEPLAQVLPTVENAARTSPPPVEPTRHIWWALAAGVALIAGALIRLVPESGYFWRSPLASARFTRLDFAGTEQAAAISRDGKLVAFLSDRDGQIDAWVSEVGSGTYRNLTQGALRELMIPNPSLRALGFSADSSLVSIWTRRADGSQPGDVNILGVPISGGALRTYLQEVAEFDWSRDGKRLAYHTTAPGDPLFVRESGTPGDRRIYVAPAGVHCHFPLWSPDDAFIYFVRGVPPDEWDIWRIQPSGAQLERLTRHNARVSYPVMLDRRTLLYLATDADGSGPWMYALDVERPVPRRISSGLEGYTSLGASADGARLVATIAAPHTSVWRMLLTEDRTGATTASDPSLLLANGVTPRLGAGLLLYVSRRGERQGIWSLRDGTSREIWSSTRARIVGGPSLAADGRHVAFSVEEGDRAVLYVMDHDGLHVRVLNDSLALRGNLGWAPDGRSIVSAVVRDGEPRVTRIFLNGDLPLPLVSEYSIDPVWSPDGRFLVYSGADIGTTFPLRAVAADGRPYPLPTVMLTRGARRVAFLRDPQTLVILGGEIVHKDFSLLDLRTGAQRILAKLPADFVVHDFDISANGSELVFDRAQVNSDLALIERTR
jgi:Tol biopolymer transport system component